MHNNKVYQNFQVATVIVNKYGCRKWRLTLLPLYNILKFITYEETQLMKIIVIDRKTLSSLIFYYFDCFLIILFYLFICICCCYIQESRAGFTSGGFRSEQNSVNSLYRLENVLLCRPLHIILASWVFQKHFS